MSESVACQNHPTLGALDRCAGCAEPFCFNCIVEMYGQRYCGSCKVMALKGQPMPELGRYPCKESTTALVLAIISIFVIFCPIIGLIFAGSSLAQAHKATQLIKANPQLMGGEKARAAKIIGSVALFVSILVWVLNIALEAD
jgi:hypothetical protein